MRTIQIALFLTLSSFMTTANAEGFYKWKDARGQIQYGDEPPPNINAKKIALPAITVLEGYGEQWQVEDQPTPVTASKPVTPTSFVPVPKPRPKVYRSLAFIAPKAGQSIKADNGDVSVMLSVKPPLKANHQFLFVMDGKKVTKSHSRIANFSNLSRGSHQLKVKIVDAVGRDIHQSEPLQFNVVR